MGTAIDPSEIKRFEITEVYSHPDAKVDIVLVHGLNGDPRATWTAKNGVFWPSQLLPVSLKSAKARVLVYGYNADVYVFGSKNSASSDMIHLHAQSLVSGLSLERKSEEATSNPIIWVAHSLGGILVKRALELSNDLTSKSADDNRNIFVSTYGVIFLGTPHTGADPAKWGIILQGMVGTLVPKKIMDSEPHLVKTLQTNNETLQNINLHFLDIYQRFKICMVHEAMKTDLKGSRSFIVDQISASPLLPDVQYFGIEATHSGMCKFESKNSPGYLNISATIKGWVEESPRVIQARLDMERKTRRQADEARAKEIMGIYDSVDSQTPQGSGQQTPALSKSYHSIATIEPDTRSLDPKEPYFIKPSGFRPNSLFVGREAELAEMHRLLFDKKRRAHGTSAVLIQSMPGGGKTHLAREYVYQHKDEFPGGIFWLRAKTLPELAAGYWDIARNGALKGSNENLSLNDPEQFIKVVRNWLNQRQNWLLVLDGIHFDDTDNLIKYIPDSPNTSLIYTSTVKSVSNDYHFMNPQVIKLPLLSAKEAQTLLLLELNKGKSPSRDDLLHSMELVQAMGFLPVVIHAVAQRLKATDEPLAKFARSYSAEPKLRGLGAYTAVVDQLKMLGAIEALNLLRILCFFSQHIPVEMIVLGLSALDVPVKAFEPISSRSLNNTFKILNSFALIDRNEPEPLHSSQSSKGSRDMIGDHVDVIRLHSVVESFFVDTLLAEGTLSLWLDRAVKVFCCSYDTACERIIRKHSPGLVEDYRLYEIHGNKLREHVKRYFKKSPVLRESLLFLDHRLQIVKGEIERRTPESSQSIAGGKQEAFHISIFDRTSSSSDTDPATPGLFDKYNTEISTWGLEVEKAQIESPISIKSYDHQTPVAPSKSAFPPLRQHDIGYDSDMDESVPETVKPVQRTLQQEDSTISSEPPWETVENRRSKPKAKPARLDLHRTVKNMEKKRYSDSLGSFRSASDPRVTHEFAHGFVHRNNSRAQSRGRISGQSQAEVALTHITTTSPPPVRGGGKIQDRRGSSGRRSQDNNRLVAGTATYAAAVTGPTRDTVSDQRQMLRPSTDSTATEYGSVDTQSSSVPSLMTSSAVQSLQRLPHEKQIPKPTHQSSPRQPPTPMPPYPRSPSPYPTYRYPYQSSDTDLYKLGGGSTYSQENLRLGPDPYSSLVYPRMTGPIPYEVLSTSPRKRDLPHDYPQWDSQIYSNMAATFPSSEYQSYPTSEQNPEFLSLSSPNITRPQYYNIREGYTSQPISRNPSDQNPPTSSSTPYNYRRPSLAETEPLPQLPTFSPMIPQAHYPSYQGSRERAVSQSTSSSNGTRRKSPRLDLAHRAALISTLEEWPDTEPLPQLVPRAQLPFNPNAPVFSPRVSRHNSPVSGGSTRRSSPAQPQAPYPTPEMGAGGVEMGRSGSGGLRVGRRMIGFGDFPELIDPQEARERARGAWAEREATSSLTGLGIRR